MGKEKDMDKELSDMLRGVPPQNILISFDGNDNDPLYHRDPQDRR